VGLLLENAGVDFEALKLQTPVARQNDSPSSALESTHHVEEKQKLPTISLFPIVVTAPLNCKMSTFGEYFRVTTYVPVQLTPPAAQGTS